MTYLIEKRDCDYLLHRIKEDIAETKVGDGVVEIKGKKYSTVGLRISKLREYFGCNISTKFHLHEASDEKVLVECELILNAENDRIVLANGFAEKRRDTNFITRTSAVEFCQTTALGRACAGLGIIGDHNIASAEEIYGASEDNNKKPKIEVIDV